MKKKDQSKRHKGGSLPRKRIRLIEPPEPPATPAPPESPESISSPGAADSPPQRGVIDILGQIKARELNPQALSKTERKLCVQHLSAEGLAVPEVAQVLGVAERTIARDRKVIQEEAALEHDPRLASLMAGRLASEAELVIQRIRRVARDREAPHAVRVEAEKSCFAVMVGLTESLQSLGYLPTAAQQIEADVRHGSAAVPGYQELSVEIDRLEAIAEETGDGQVVTTLKKLRSTATRARVVERLGDVQASLSQEEDEEDSDDS